ncbi:MAG: cryptochrome/photolyase family protein, partial [Gammaproteobacteria bacterium]|nr:cryptochrome/photolyase family protein [Gammaproteobacteria bacterium]
MRNLCIVLGDQLNHDSLLWQQFDPKLDCVWMAEVADESEKIRSSKTRTTFFLSAMRHFNESLKSQGYRVDYLTLSEATE